MSVPTSGLLAPVLAAGSWALKYLGSPLRPLPPVSARGHLGEAPRDLAPPRPATSFPCPALHTIWFSACRLPLSPSLSSVMPWLALFRLCLGFSIAWCMGLSSLCCLKNLPISEKGRQLQISFMEAKFKSEGGIIVAMNNMMYLMHINVLGGDGRPTQNQAMKSRLMRGP